MHDSQEEQKKGWDEIRTGSFSPSQIFNFIFSSPLISSPPHWLRLKPHHTNPLKYLDIIKVVSLSLVPLCRARGGGGYVWAITIFGERRLGNKRQRFSSWLTVPFIHIAEWYFHNLGLLALLNDEAVCCHYASSPELFEGCAICTGQKGPRRERQRRNGWEAETRRERARICWRPETKGEPVRWNTAAVELLMAIMRAAVINGTS